jgi:hypothetical protein
MKSRRPLATALLLLLVWFFGRAAMLLKRGDFLQQSDDSLYFSRIGFTVSDNTVINPTLTKNAVVDIKDTSTNIYIQVPYVTDTTVPLVVSFDVVSKDAVTEYWNTALPGWDALESGTTQLTFNTVGLRVRRSAMSSESAKPIPCLDRPSILRRSGSTLPSTSAR